MIVAIVLLYFGFNFLKGIDFFSNSNTYYAYYDNVDKLAESNQVMLNGYAVGRVSKIEIQQAQNRVLVSMDIDSDIVLGDSSVAVLNGELLGGRFIQLEIERRFSKQLQPGDTLRAEVAKGIADLIAEQAAPLSNNLQHTFRKIDIILDGLDSVVVALKVTPALLNKTLATTNKNIDGLGGSFQSVAGNLNATLTDLKPTLENLKVFSDSLKHLQINAAISNAEQALGHLNQTLAKVNKGDNTISKLMNDDEVYRNLNKLLNSLDTLANHLDENPRHFFAPFGKKAKVKK